MNFLKRRTPVARENHEPQQPTERTAVETYLAGGGNPANDRAMALMMEVDRGRDRQTAEHQRREQRRNTLNLPPPPEPTGDPIADGIAAARHADLVRRAEREAELAEQRDRFAADDEARAAFLTYCRPSTAAEYADWLRGHLTRGGKITHARAGDTLDGFWTLTDYPASVPTLYGASSLEVIVLARSEFKPRDLPRTFHGACGHSTFYFLDGFHLVGGYVPLYDDVQELLTS
ncbi:hypothetical protein ABZ949_02115 [Micromonospora tulbaghiae]|uniref:hypothetical protein n=1 Tax=Micromonospora tulbaghiae TaxID=479978 RepID=UPI0033FF0927